MKLSKDRIIQIILLIIIIVLIIAYAGSKNESGQILKFGEQLENQENTEPINIKIGDEEMVVKIPDITGTSKPTPVTIQTQTAPATASSDLCTPNLSGERSEQYKAVLLKWSQCTNDDFQFYKLVKSSLNSNPVYPGDDVIMSSSDKRISNFIDKVVTRGTTYNYRICAVHRLNKISCSNKVSVKY